MIYSPSVYGVWEWEYKSVDYLLFSDPILYAWIYWETEYAKSNLGLRLEIQREPVALAGFFMPRFWVRNRSTLSPFVPPV